MYGAASAPGPPKLKNSEPSFLPGPVAGDFATLDVERPEAGLVVVLRDRRRGALGAGVAAVLPVERQAGGGRRAGRDQARDERAHGDAEARG